MKTFAPFVMGSAASLLLAANTAALASTGPARPMPPFHLICDGGPDEPVCRALADALADAGKGREVHFFTAADAPSAGAPLTVRFVPERRTEDSLSGHLAWTGPGGIAASGPTLELSVMDSFLNRDALDAYAAQLILHSNLPL